jgi:hypothetical protein
MQNGSSDCLNNRNLQNENSLYKDGFVHDNDKLKNCGNQKKPPPKDDALFDIFGIKLYSDDILLVSLIFLLYSEGVKDDSLFIALVLLLLS